MLSLKFNLRPKISQNVWTHQSALTCSRLWHQINLFIHLLLSKNFSNRWDQI